MSTANRQIQRSAATRQALLRVARRMFAKFGYGGTATEEIVRKARVTRGALYHHFRDKQDLFIAVLAAEQRKLAEIIMLAAMKAPDAWSSLVAGSQAFLEACADPAVRRIVLT